MPRKNFVIVREVLYNTNMLSWRIRRQLAIVFLVLLPFLVIGIFAVRKFVSLSSCMDTKQNQGETGVDCGGPCAPCELKNPKPITLFWARAVRVRPSVYTAVAEIKNPHEALSAVMVTYEFTLFDDTGPIAVREGRTYLLAQERTSVIESSIGTTREPIRVEFKITHVNWQLGAESKPNVVVDDKKYRIEEEQGRRQSVAEARIANRTDFDIRALDVHFLIFDEHGNVMGANKVREENLLAGSSRSVFSRWPEELPGKKITVEVEPRINIFDSEAIVRPQ